MIFRRPLGATGQPGRQECRSSSRDTFSIFEEKAGGPLGLGAPPSSGADGVGVAEGVADTGSVDTGVAATGERDAAGDVTAAGTDVRAGAEAAPPASGPAAPPQPVTPTSVAIITADLRFFKKPIGAEYPRPQDAPTVVHNLWITSPRKRSPAFLDGRLPGVRTRPGPETGDRKRRKPPLGWRP
ncbi:hypothetical protein GCM10023074_27590 [Microbispora amethystogenes]|uniref:Uncharacterized protein n=1 Tax=Microbispora amethystogenes TaxID=1427754 RepID=A0ABQ4F9Q5_9ACTN|nr:hypothetical protein Mam01_17060 [Microbispora amethystogenes]